MAVVGAAGRLLAVVATSAADGRRDAQRHSLARCACRTRFRHRRRKRRSSSPARPCPKPKADRVYAVERIGRRADRAVAKPPTRPAAEGCARACSCSAARTRAAVIRPARASPCARSAAMPRAARLLVLDGVPQTDPFGGWVNWPAYDPADLRGIRVVRGGGSVANGPGALAGTIEMTSRADIGVSGELDGGSRDSLEARGRARSCCRRRSAQHLRPRRSAATASFRSRKRRADQPTSARPTASGAGAGAGSRRSAATTELQASFDGFHDWRTRGTDFSAEPHQRRRCLASGWSGAARGNGAHSAYWQWRNLMSSFASVSPGRITATRVSLQDSVPSHGLGGSLEIRPPMPCGFEVRLGADARRTSGESRELFSYVAGDPTRRRFAGGESWTSGAFAEASADLGRVHSDGRNSARSLAGLATGICSRK